MVLIYLFLENSLHWCHNEHDGVSNHQPYDCLLHSLFRQKSKKTLKLSITGLCEGNSPVTGEFPAQRASNAEYVSIWWSHHVTNEFRTISTSILETEILITEITRSGWLNSRLGYPLLGEIYTCIFIFFLMPSFTSFTIIFQFILKTFQINRDPCNPKI